VPDGAPSAGRTRRSRSGRRWVGSSRKPPKRAAAGGDCGWLGGESTGVVAGPVRDRVEQWFNSGAIERFTCPFVAWASPTESSCPSRCRRNSASRQAITHP
jgi:hypothetical protein